MAKRFSSWKYMVGWYCIILMQLNPLWRKSGDCPSLAAATWRWKVGIHLWVSSCWSGIAMNYSVNTISVLNNVLCFILTMLKYGIVQTNFFYDWKLFKLSYISPFNVFILWMTALFPIFDLHCWNKISSNCLNMYVKYYIFGTVWYRPHFYTLYLEEPDSSGHKFGPVSSGVSSFVVS